MNTHEATSWNQNKYIKAYLFAANAHKGQPFSGNPDLPYIVHTSLVSMEVMSAIQGKQGVDGNLATQCDLLHDAIENTADTATPITYDDIKAEFGESVASGVLALSKNKGIDKPLQMADSLHRIQQQPPEVWMVKLADRITNLLPPPASWDAKKIAEYRQESISILTALGSANSALAERLKTKIENYPRKAN